MIAELRRIEKLVKKEECVSEAEFSTLDVMIPSLRHNCEMWNQEITEEIKG